MVTCETVNLLGAGTDADPYYADTTEVNYSVISTDVEATPKTCEICY